MEITNIKQLLPFIADKPEFLLLDKGDYQVIDYVYQDNDTFDKPELMECRGIKFDREGLILARPFSKFFNYGERGSDLPAHRPHVITEKLDGSMIHPVLLTRRLFFHTRKGHTDVAMKAERYVLSSPQHNYQGFCIDALKHGWTPIFEYTGPNNRIVLRYEEEALTLLAMRHTVGGHFLNRERMLNFMAATHRVPLVNVFDMTLDGQVDKFVQHTRGLSGAEGYVIYFDDGYLVKIKAEEYVLKHRALDDLGSKKKVVALCAQGFMDDVLAILGDEDAKELAQFNHELQHEIAGIVADVHSLVSNNYDEKIDGTEARKQFAIVTSNLVPSHIRSAAFTMLDGKDPRLPIINSLIRNPDMVMTKWRGE